LKHELRQLIPVILFFFVAFQLLALTETMMLEQYGIRVSTFLTATVAALVVAKVVLIADHLPFVDRFPETMPAKWGRPTSRIRSIGFWRRKPAWRR
jgi:hypothetical protein